jgi:hypothetical protein
VSEWLSHPGTLERLAPALCYAPTARPFAKAKRVHRATATSDTIVSPSFLAKRAPGGRAERRPVAWVPPEAAQAALRAANRLDLELYEWAAGRELARLRRTRAAEESGLPRAGEIWRDWELF